MSNGDILNDAGQAGCILSDLGKRIFGCDADVGGGECVQSVECPEGMQSTEGGRQTRVLGSEQ
ncbi:MAG TPA: hypothetical protein DC058_06390, partial [Planctomycetaceae bacterium]|nr:hypothetical protein [Planctomycetaceae bacterium]